MWNGLGGICWTGGYGFGAFLLGNQVHRLLGPLGLGIGAVAAVVIVWLIFFVRRHEARLIREAERELARYERTGRLKPVMAGPEPAIQGAAPGDGSDPRK